MGTDLARLEPGPNGGMLNRSGRIPSSARRAILEARNDLSTCLRRLQEIRDDPDSSADEVVKACLGILKLSGADREKPKTRTRLNLSVTRATAGEQRAKMSAATTSTPPDGTAPAPP